MLDICLSGTGGTLPQTDRWLTSLMVRCNGHAALIDCGEGTQIALQKAGQNLSPIDIILITHIHADHISGLPGLLLTMGKMGRTEPVTIIGPVGTEQIVNSLRCIAPFLTFELTVRELEAEETLLSFQNCELKAFAVEHDLPCLGYSFSLPRAGKFDAARAKELGVPMPLWKRLQKGETIEQDGRTYTPDMVMGAPRRGLKVTYCTDSRPLPSIAAAAAGSDLFICEGMYGDDEKLDKAVQNKHMLFSEAAQMAAQAGGVKELWLTHYSPSMPNPDDYLDVARAIFPNTHTPKDGWSKTLVFDEA